MTSTPIWRKSSYSDSGQNCVELADVGASIFVRDSKRPDDGPLAFNRTELSALIDAAKAGELDDLC